MSWNISFMCVKASKEQIDDIIPDVFYKSEENLYFEDATSYRMEGAMGVTELNGWVIVSDPANRVSQKEGFAQNVSQKFEVKTFFISEDPIFSHYSGGKAVESAQGMAEIDAVLRKKGIQAEDEYGETKAFQLFDHEILPGLKGGWNEHLFSSTFDKYELD